MSSPVVKSSAAGNSRAAQKKRKRKSKGGEILHDVKKPIASKSFETIDSFAGGIQTENDDIKSKILHACDVYDSYPITVTLNLEEVKDINSDVRAAVVIAKCINPMNFDEFKNTIWEKKPHYFQHSDAAFLKGIFSRKSMMKYFETHVFLEKTDIIFCPQEDRLVFPWESAEEECKEMSQKDILKMLQSSCCVVLPNMQKYDDQLWKLSSCLEHFVNCCININVCYFTARTQSATSSSSELSNSSAKTLCDFMTLQLEGETTYTIYGAESETMSVVLQRGDVLYVPKGHRYDAQNKSAERNALNLKLIFANSSSIASLLDILVPNTMQGILDGSSLSPHFRYNLPPNYSRLLGVSASETEDINRDSLQDKVKTSLTKFAVYAMEYLDQASDEVSSTWRRR